MPELTFTILSYLDVRPSDNILDLGCGDGVLTARIASQAAFVLGLDSSGSMIASARQSYGQVKNCRFDMVDCRFLDDEALRGSFDKVFSNAALHWILCDPSTRSAVFESVREVLRPRGWFVFEMGGHGNVAEVHTAFRAVLSSYHSGMEEVRSRCPWFFPSKDLIRGMLEKAGFEVLRVETEWRPTRLTEDGGLEGWVRLMGASWMDGVEGEDMKEELVRQVCDVLEDVVRREEDGSMWLNYVRLRAVARKL